MAEQKIMDVELNIPNKEIPILPLRDIVVFPGITAPITVGKPASVKLVDDVSIGGKVCGLVLQKKTTNKEPQYENLYKIGTLARIVKMFKLPTNTVYLLAQGMERIEITKFLQKEPYIKAQINIIKEERKPNTPEIEARMRNLLSQFQKAVSLSPKIPQEESYITAINIKEPGRLADFIIANLSLTIQEQQDILETLDPMERLDKAAKFLNKELEVLMLQSKIQEETKSKLGKAQREYFLRQQLESIKKELGEESENAVEIKELKKQIEEAGMSEEAKKEAKRELSRLEKLPPQAAEFHVIRTYLDWLVSVPWNKTTKDNLDIQQAEKVLNEDHHDLEKIKDRILEFLAVMNLKKDTKGPILCFAGPPGVGKTSLGQSIARALGRKFIRLSLGGIRDEAEIRGHRRTYIGALPGRIIQGLRRAGTNNPVFMLDEVDKIGIDFRGDPSSALLEVLDPEQNHSFSDHYLDVAFDLSKVMFITTANILDTVPPALRDRMEVLQLPGYPEEEKLIIAKKFLLPRQTKENGLKPEDVKISDSAIKKVIHEYTREAGVRNVERELANILRKIAKEIAKGKKSPFEIDEKNIASYLGPIKFFSETAERTSEPGVATGLAWTPQGGEILFIEANKMSGKKGLTLTGQLGQTMQESAKAALSYIRSTAKKLKIDEKFFEKQDIHIHVPQGAVPKDGPSAGVAIATSLVSMLMGKPVKYDVAMTGEITLKGKVLPVGGIKEKVLAASRAGIKEVILPALNKKDLEELPPHVKKELKFTFVKNLDEVLAHALKNRTKDKRPPPAYRLRAG